MDNYRCQAYLSHSESVESVGGLTALHLACLHNRLDVISMLLQAEAGKCTASWWSRNRKEGGRWASNIFA